MTKISINRYLFLAALALAAGCSRPDAPSETPPQSPSKHLLSTEPAGAQSVAEVRKSAAGEEHVVVVGRIGGDANPWVDGIAAFLITDTSLTPCNERPGDNCRTPWDYCCDLDVLKDLKVMVKLVDADGQPLGTDARTLLNLEELQTVVVRGRARRDEAGNLTILATGVFVRS